MMISLSMLKKSTITLPWLPILLRRIPNPVQKPIIPVEKKDKVTMTQLRLHQRG